jgi:hypothetical protein
MNQTSPKKQLFLSMLVGQSPEEALLCIHLEQFTSNIGGAGVVGAHDAA